MPVAADGAARLAAALPPLTTGRVLAGWQFAPVVTAVLAAAAAAYLTGAWRVARRHPARPWPTARTGAFLLGLAVIAAATQSGVGRYDGTAFSMHMVQHVLLIMVAPPLLVWGRPLTLLLHSAGNPVHTWVKRALRSRAAATLTCPPVALLAYALVVAGTHTPPVMDFVLRNDAAHNAEHATYLLTGYLFFLLAAGSEPIRWQVSMPGRYLLLLAAMQVDTVVGVVLMIAGHEIFPGYAGTPPAWGAGPLADLHRGGVIMFAGSDIVMTVLALAVSVAFLRSPRSAGRLGGWAEGVRTRALLRNLAAAGVRVPSRLAAGRTVDDDAHLAAYNAYLAAVSERDRHPGSPGPAH